MKRFKCIDCGVLFVRRIQAKHCVNCSSQNIIEIKKYK